MCGRRVLTTALLCAAVAMVGCDDDDSPTASTDQEYLQELTVQGDGQSAVTGRVLRDSVLVRGVVESGDDDFFGWVHFELVSGGGVLRVGDDEADEVGEEVMDLTGSEAAALEWELGPAGTEQRVRAWALRTASDTVETFLTATSVEDTPLEELTATGDEQSAGEGELLPDTIKVQAVEENGYPWMGDIHVEILAGDGEVDLGDEAGSEVGTILTETADRNGVVDLVWTMGTAGEEHRIRAFALRSETDTVSVEITATSLDAPPVGG